ncbi:MAG: hypothetical protein ACRCX8_00760 [Sarcina sp.]
MKKPMRKKFTLENRIQSLKGKTIRMSNRIEKNIDDTMDTMERAIEDFKVPETYTVPGINKGFIYSKKTGFPYIDDLMDRRVIVLDATTDEAKASVSEIVHEDNLYEENIAGLTPLPLLLSTRRLCPVIALMKLHEKEKMDILINHEFIHAMFNIFYIYTLSARLELYSERVIDQLLKKTPISEMLAYNFENYKVDSIFRKSMRRQRTWIIRRTEFRKKTWVLKSILGMEVK